MKMKLNLNHYAMKTVLATIALKAAFEKIEPFDFPSPSIAPQFPTILDSGFLAVAFVRCNQFHLLLLEPLAQWVAVVCEVANEAFGLFTDGPFFQ
jgi:hypothetical protein